MNDINRCKTVERTLRVTRYFLETRKTVRAIAKDLGLNKSTVHRDLRYVLPEIDRELAKEVGELLDYHKEIKHIIGGQKTKEKWAREKVV